VCFNRVMLGNLYMYRTQPPRSAHPVVKFSCVPCEPVTIENLPFDKYELEPSPLTQHILERRQPNVAWQVWWAFLFWRAVIVWYLGSWTFSINHYLHQGVYVFINISLFVSRIMQKLRGLFSQNSMEGGTWATEETIRFWW